MILGRIVAPTLAAASVRVELHADGECTFTRIEGRERWEVSTRGPQITINVTNARENQGGERRDATTAEVMRALAKILTSKAE